MSGSKYPKHWSTPKDYARNLNWTSGGALKYAVDKEYEWQSTDWPNLQTAVMQLLYIEWWFELAYYKEILEREAKS